jgi:hypothetical protein
MIYHLPRQRVPAGQKPVKFVPKARTPHPKQEPSKQAYDPGYGYRLRGNKESGNGAFPQLH